MRTLLARLKEQANTRFAVSALEEPAYGVPVTFRFGASWLDMLIGHERLMVINIVQHRR